MHLLLLALNVRCYLLLNRIKQLCLFCSVIQNAGTLEFVIPLRSLECAFGLKNRHQQFKKSSTIASCAVKQWFSNFLRCDAFKKACETLRRTRQHPTV